MNTERLKRFRAKFEANLGNTFEGYWQKFFEANARVVSQVFLLPCILCGSQAYTGGKFLSNKGGNLSDFTHRNKLAKKLAIVEKSDTPLLGKPYRGKSCSISEELSGAVNQVLSYRQFLLNEFNSRYVNSGGIDDFSPHCVVVIRTAKQFDGHRKRDRSRAFATRSTE